MKNFKTKFQLKSNEQGFTTFVLVLLVAAVVASGVAGATFANYRAAKEAQNLRSLIFTTGILEQLGAEALQAHREYLSHITALVIPAPLPGTCPAGLVYYPSYNSPISATETGFCFPDKICVQDPNAPTEQLCDRDNPAGIPTLFEIIPVQPGGVVKTKIPLQKKIKKTWYAFGESVYKKFTYFTSTSFALFNVLEDFGASPAGTALPINAGPACVGTLCKDCSQRPGDIFFDPATPPPGGPEEDYNLKCIRFRVCPRYTQCNVGDNNEWIIQKIGVLHAPPDP